MKFYNLCLEKGSEKGMGKIRKPRPVMLFIGMLSSDIVLMDEAVTLLQTAFGPILHQTSDLSWSYTDYYVEELGENIFRRFLFFENLILPDRIAGIKVETNRIEDRYTRPVKGKPLRRINLDPGYLDASRIISARNCCRPLKDWASRSFPMATAIQPSAIGSSSISSGRSGLC